MIINEFISGCYSVSLIKANISTGKEMFANHLLLPYCATLGLLFLIKGLKEDHLGLVVLGIYIVERCFRTKLRLSLLSSVQKGCIVISPPNPPKDEHKDDKADQDVNFDV